jgi:hypothetical protein
VHNSNNEIDPQFVGIEESKKSISKKINLSGSFANKMRKVFDCIFSLNPWLS